MGEHAWHRKTRIEFFEAQKPKKAFTSHSDISKLELFRVEDNDRPRRINCYSDADIVVFNPESDKIETIIEIESAFNPKKIIGIILATHLCNVCRIKKENYELSNVTLRIVYKKAPVGSKKDLKTESIKPHVDNIIDMIKGSVQKVLFEAYE